MKMKITVNGENRVVADNTCVADYLKELEINMETVVVECDGIILERDDYGTQILKDGAVLELIRFIGGG